jgi:hypothetical protein
MARKQFATTIVTEGTLDTTTQTTYPNGGVVNEDGSAYPYTLDPSETIEELIIQDVDPDVDVVITTTGGDTFTLPVSERGVFNRWQIETVEFKDPTGTAASVGAVWGGE